MTNSTIGPQVFLACAAVDMDSAVKMRDMLEAQGAEVVAADHGRGSRESALQSIRSQVSVASVVFVLIGPRTRASRWADQELALTTHGNSGRIPGMVAVLLPEHEDFARPFCDPQNIPLRLREDVSRESSLLRKWPDDSGGRRRWITEAGERRRRFPVLFMNFSFQSALGRFEWDEAVDELTQ